MPGTSTTGASTLTVTGGVSMRRTGSGGSGGMLAIFDSILPLTYGQPHGPYPQCLGSRGTVRVSAEEKQCLLVCTDLTCSTSLTLKRILTFGSATTFTNAINKYHHAVSCHHAATSYANSVDTFSAATKVEQPQTR